MHAQIKDWSLQHTTMEEVFKDFPIRSMAFSISVEMELLGIVNPLP